MNNIPMEDIYVKIGKKYLRMVDLDENVFELFLEAVLTHSVAMGFATMKFTDEFDDVETTPSSIDPTIIN